MKIREIQKMEKILSEHARKRKQLRIETATILVHEFGEFLPFFRPRNPRTINSDQSVTGPGGP